jgi:hypothetical protein
VSDKELGRNRKRINTEETILQRTDNEMMGEVWTYRKNKIWLSKTFSIKWYGDTKK